MTNNIESINSNEQKENKGGLLERIRNSSRKVIAPVIAAGSISLGGLPAATIPVAGATAVSLLTACSDEPDNPLDNTAPTINVSQYDIDITGGKQVRVSGNQLYIGDVLVASRTDNVTKNCKVELSLNGKPITSGTTVSEEGYLTVKVTDDAGNTRTIDIKLNVTQNAPSITVNKYEVNVFGGVTVNVNNNQLLFGDEVVATRTDEDLSGCKYTLSFNGHEVKSGDTINESGKFTLSVTNKLGKSSVVEITITNDAIYGLENLRQALLKVDSEINLLNGLTFAEGAELVNTEIEIDGKRNTIADPTQYVPEYPGVCNIIFTVKGRNGNMVECRVDNLTINALEYNAPTINTANMINNHYSWYNNLRSSTKEFIYPHLLASYAACNWSKQDNRVHVIMGETADTDDIENIGQFSEPTNHAYQGYYRIRALCPNVSIKGCYDYWVNLENYINNHPNKFFIISCAKDAGGGSNWGQFNSNPETAPLRRLLDKENVIVIVANSNRSQNVWKVYNEDIKDGTKYNSGSVNSNKNNKITIVGYNTFGSNNFFSPSSTGEGLLSSMPVGYKKVRGNVVMPMSAIIDSNNQENLTTASSYPTAVTSGVLGNAVSLIMSNHPGITAEDAMTIIVNNYLNEQKFQYKDESTNYSLVDGGEWYFIDMQKLLDTELLQLNSINNLQFSSNLVKLPSGKGVCYMGKGIQFEFNGKKYDTTSASQSILNQALRSGNVVWYRNKQMFKKYGGTTSAQFDVYVVDKDGNKIPDLHKTITKSVI